MEKNMDKYTRIEFQKTFSTSLSFPCLILNQHAQKTNLDLAIKCIFLLLLMTSSKPIPGFCLLLTHGNFSWLRR